MGNLPIVIHKLKVVVIAFECEECPSQCNIDFGILIINWIILRDCSQIRF